METKNSQISSIEHSLTELSKIIYDKDAKILQLQKDKDYLQDTIVNSRYEYEAINDENEKLKKQINTHIENKKLLKKEVQEKILEIKSLENSKREEIQQIQIKSKASLKTMEDNILEINEFIEELKSKNEYFRNIIELNKNEEELLKYDNYNLQKQIEDLKTTIEEEKKIKRYEYKGMNDSSTMSSDEIEASNLKEEKLLEISNRNLKKQVQVLRKSIEEEKAKRYKEPDILIPSKEQEIKNNVEEVETNSKLDNFEKKFQGSKKIIEKEKDEETSILTEEDILKNNLGL